MLKTAPVFPRADNARKPFHSPPLGGRAEGERGMLEWSGHEHTGYNVWFVKAPTKPRQSVNGTRLISGQRGGLYSNSNTFGSGRPAGNFLRGGARACRIDVRNNKVFPPQSPCAAAIADLNE